MSRSALLASGAPCRVVIRHFQPLHMTDAASDPLYAFALTVIPESGAPYAVKVGNPVPTEALPHMYPGAQLPATVLADDPRGIVIDWAATAASPG